METGPDRPPIVAYDNPFVTLENCGGYYKRPPGGPVIATGDFSLVLEQYYRFSMAFKHQNSSGRRYVLEYWGRRLTNKITLELLPVAGKSAVDFFLGIPPGGYELAQILGENNKQARVIQAIMRNGELAPMPQINPGDRGIVVLDTANSCKTAAKAVAAVKKQDASIMALACVCARFITELSESRNGTRISLVALGPENMPLMTLAQKAMPPSRRDDPRLAGSEIIDNPESDEAWKRLLELMVQPKR
ncbi:MAG TPA: hypothetical protein VF390_01950 [Patescibacteria group bacterium]